MRAGSGKPYKTDAVFIAKIKESKPAVNKVAKWLRRHGFNIYVPPIVIRPDVSVREKYMDDFDIHLFLGDAVNKIDVKGNPKRSFAMGTWPWKTIIAQSVYDTNRKGFPWRVFQVNKELTCAIAINTKKNRRHCFKCLVYNTEIKEKVWYWKIPMVHTKYIDLTI
jgi:hypothetical protein